MDHVTREKIDELILDLHLPEAFPQQDSEELTDKIKEYGGKLIHCYPFEESMCKER